jgi:hypothetical protein
MGEFFCLILRVLFRGKELFNGSSRTPIRDVGGFASPTRLFIIPFLKYNLETFGTRAANRGFANP